MSNLPGSAGAAGHKSPISWLLAWITEPRKRAILAFLGAGLAALAGGAWAVYTYIHPVEFKGSATYRLCIGPKDGKKWCPKDTLFVPDQGENTVSQWAKRMCPQFEQAGHDTDKCISCYVVQVVCNLK